MEITEECAGPEDLLEDLTRRESIEHVRQAVLSLPPVFVKLLFYVTCRIQVMKRPLRLWIVPSGRCDPD